MSFTLGWQLDRPEAGADRTEILHESGRTRIRRVRLGGGPCTVLHKEPLGADSEERRRHETAVLQRLAGVPGVVQLAGGAAGPEVIALEDLGGNPLAAARAVSGPALVDLAFKLATVLSGVHRHGVVHKDLSPANVIVTAGGDPVLIDFELATTFAEDRPGFVHQSQIAGTLAYMAPEQTGRTGGSVDQRADLYSLGAILFELAVGRPPFPGDDAVDVIHRHLAEPPEAPSDLDPGVPRVLSDIILRLLAKEPDKRYQSAEGLAYDLRLLRARLAAGDPAPVVLGEHDFPPRLTLLSRPVGRDAETAALKTAFEGSLRGETRAVLVCGPPGVGKASLIDQLRPVVAARGGWFVTGKFDQNRSDVASDAVGEAIRGVCRLLLAEPEARLADMRARIDVALGANARLVASVVPELGDLLDLPADETSAPDDSEDRLVQGFLQLLRAVVSPDRPLIVLLDGLQRGGSGPVRFLDGVLRDEDLDGLLAVGSFLPVDDGHPLATMLARWQRLGCAPTVLELANLSVADLSGMLAEMLRLPEDTAAALGAAVAARTGGNPYDSVELVDSLRRAGVLTLGDTGWTWDPAALQTFVGDGDVVDLLVARLQRLPTEALSLIDVIAGLAGDVDLDLLAAAAGEPAPRILEHLAPALEDGLLVLERTGGAVRFSHDRVRQAAAELAPADRTALHLTTARRLAGHAQFAAVAAQQYLAAVDDVREPAECRRVIGLFRLAAARMHLVNAVAAEQFLAAAVRLVAEVDAADREPLLADLRTEWHTALFALGRLAEADEIYHEIERRDPGPLVLVSPACVHMSSLTARGRTGEAVALAFHLLRRLGLRVPDVEDLDAEARPTLEALAEWVEQNDERNLPERPEITDPRITAAARVINRVMPAAFFSDQRTMGWLTAEACRLWTAYGPHAALVCPIAHGVVVTAAQDDYRTGYAAVRRVLAAGEERGYEPATSQARFLFAVSAGHWFEPLEDDIHQARQAYEGLVRTGDLMFASFTFHASTPSMLDSASSLDSYATEVEAGISFTARTGNEQANSVALPFRQLVRALRDESGDPAAGFADPEYLAVTEGHPMAAAYHHITRALVAAILADADGLRHHSAAAMPLLPFIRSHYSTARAYLLRALALADGCRTGDPGERAALLAEFDDCRQWLARRAADAPATFGHLVRLLDAERAWAAGAYREAAVAFDAALDEVAPRRRPWQHALITEHAARFHLAAGTSRTGRALLIEAAQLYRSWGAAAKVRQLEEAHRFLHGRVGIERLSTESTVTTRVAVDSLDLIGVLKASQALSSETNLDSLRRRVVDIMRTLTGADRVRVLVRREDEGWFLAQDGDAAAVPVAEAGERGLLPLSAFRYAERTRTPLLVADATTDDRFARDPYVAPLDCCSLLVVPILTKGTPRAMVVLENRLVRNIFTPDRLDAVLLIAGQLAVSLENATLYASLERKVTERTQELAAANRQLQQLSVTDPLTGLANRRQFGDQLQAEWQRALRAGTALAVAMIDVDHFKVFNDHYGHPAGDVCLRRVAGAVRDAVRTEDIVARYGGEEFVLVLAGRAAEEARTAAERVRAAVEAIEEPHVKSATGRVTVSIGVAAVVPDGSSSPEELIEAADAQLYQAKRAGRNRVA